MAAEYLVRRFTHHVNIFSPHILDGKMILSKLTLDDVLKLVQIIFYIIGAIVAILTYRSAKKGFLNTVNTEYKKRVMDRLKELSDELASEFNPGSSNYWGKTMSTIDMVEQVNKEFIANKKAILKSGSFSPGRVRGNDEKRLESLVQTVKTDPFLPRSIRTLIEDSLDRRSKTITEIYFDELEKYANELAKGNYISSKEFEMNWIWVHNKINDRLYKSGLGIGQIEKEVDKIRLAIQDYFESFDPLPKSKNKR